MTSLWCLFEADGGRFPCRGARRHPYSTRCLFLPTSFLLVLKKVRDRIVVARICERRLSCQRLFGRSDCGKFSIPKWAPSVYQCLRKVCSLTNSSNWLG